MAVEFHCRHHPLNSSWRDISSRVIRKTSDLYALIHVQGAAVRVRASNAELETGRMKRFRGTRLRAARPMIFAASGE